jgi:hypothetical protein
MEKTIKKTDTLRGPASVRKLRGSVQVRMKEDDPKGKFKKGDTYEVALENCPRVIMDGDGYWVNMNKDGTVLYSQSPLRTQDRARFVQWAGKPGAIPEPRYDAGGRNMTTKDGRSFITQPSVSMDAVYEITTGKYKGLTAVWLGPYIFVPDSKGCVGLEGGAKQMDKAEGWMEAHGITKQVERLAYQENLLPRLAALLKDSPDVDVEIENGLVVRLSEAEADARPAKRAAKAEKEPAGRSRR